MTGKGIPTIMDLQSQFIISDRHLQSGDQSFPLTPFVASIQALPEDGSTLSVSRPQETHSLSQVRHLAFCYNECPLTLLPRPRQLD